MELVNTLIIKKNRVIHILFNVLKILIEFINMFATSKPSIKKALRSKSSPTQTRQGFAGYKLLVTSIVLMLNLSSFKRFILINVAAVLQVAEATLCCQIR